MKVNIRIGRLVLHGFEYHDHKRISAAMEQELARLIRENGLPQGFAKGGEILRIDAPSFNAPEDMDSKIIGTEAARSIYKAWETLFSETTEAHHILLT